jgi:hypothetical protein
VKPWSPSRYAGEVTGVHRTAGKHKYGGEDERVSHLLVRKCLLQCFNRLVFTEHSADFIHFHLAVSLNVDFSEVAKI